MSNKVLEFMWDKAQLVMMAMIILLAGTVTLILLSFGEWKEMWNEEPITINQKINE